MSNIGDIERKTQKKVIKLFEEKLKYRYLGDFTDEITTQMLRQRF